ncbi:hypothetical protein BU17DRAFT_81421 [Hysterangium stoloniferum]|nr:hypothetical protein BU17DRAFT_81421 [Hysterangium stoloniferum]
MTTPGICDIQLQGRKSYYNHVLGFRPGISAVDQNSSALIAQQEHTPKTPNPLQNYSSDFVSTILEDNEQLKFQLQTLIMDRCSLVTHLSEYMLLYKGLNECNSRLEAKLNDLEKKTACTPAKKNDGQQVTRKGYETEALQNCDTQQNQLIQGIIGLKVNHAHETLEYKPKYSSPEEIMKTRLNILAQLPVPEGLPSDDLKPLKIPAGITLKEFLEDKAFDPLRQALSGYCVFTELTAMWCPDQEEHGFYLTPLYKCETSSRSNVIHRWGEVEVKVRMAQPTECFYKRQSDWYYAGTYKAFRLPDLTPEEYAELSQEACS